MVCGEFIITNLLGFQAYLLTVNGTAVIFLIRFGSSKASGL
jgi:hypothetical protein